MPGAGLSRALQTMRNADLETLRRIGPLQRGVPRAQVTVPVSPDGTVLDTTLFQDPADPAKVLYLPRYRLRVTPGTGRYEITTERVDGQWRMTFGLESFPAPELEPQLAGAAILPHDLAVSVSSGAQLVRDYPVAELTPGLGSTQVRPEVVLLLSLPERDALLRAFTRDEEQARLVVRRSVTVAVPALARRPVPVGQLVLAGPAPHDTFVILPDLISHHPLPVPEPIQFVEPDPTPVGQPGPGRDQLQLMTQILREHRLDLSLQLQRLDVGGRLGVDPGLTRLPLNPLVRDHRTPLPGDGPVVRDHRLPGPGRPVNLPDPRPDPRPDPDPVLVGDQPEPRFMVVSTTLDDVLPLRFDVAAHPYLFPSGQPPATGGFTTLVLPWPADGPSARNHVYFQDQNVGNVFYHLPDAFLVGQRQEAPFGPELSFTVGRASGTDGGTDGGMGGPDSPRAQVSVHLVPQTSPARLMDAAVRLAEHVPAGGGAPDLRPAVHPATCRLELPGGAVTTAAPPDLVSGWWVSESFPFDGLREVYAVLTTGGATSALLRGRVDVQVGDQVHQVPVEVRLDRPAVPPLDWTETAGAAGAVSVTLRNEGEVTVTVPPLPAWVVTSQAPSPATLTGGLPAQLAPGGTLDLTLDTDDVPPGPGRPADGPPQVLLDLSGVRVLVDPEQAVQQTLDRRVERLPRVVTLVTTPAGLGTTGDPERDLSLIGVQFDGVSGAVLLDHGTLQADVAVPVPLQDWLLDRGQGSFSYRQTLLHASGSSVSDTAWRTTDSNLLALPQP